LAESWLGSLPGIREHEPLSRHSWYGIGGPARYFLELTEDRELGSLLPRLTAEGIRYTLLGAGTNTLFQDGELDGLTIKLSSSCFQVEGTEVSVCAGYLMPRLAAEAARAGLSGLEFGAGVPGSVGGSIFGNAGAFGAEVKDRLVSAEVVDPQGKCHVLNNQDCDFGYRDSVFKSRTPDWVVVRARFQTTPADPAVVRETIKRVQKHRRDTQPIEKRSLGSTFKNPPGDAAGRLVDACGLKGLRIGQAQISPKHANFIVNLGGATAADVLALMAEMRERVKQKFGIELEPEVRVVSGAEG
jgi:UDP-N-acetylmuramate dehydrogenase